MDPATRWRRCGCAELEVLGRRPTAKLSSFQVQLMDGLPDKARTYPGSRVIQVDRARWAEWSALQRQAVLEHEAAHEEDPKACEPCTDARAGARMRWAGVSLVAAVEALGSIVETRGARESVRVGWLAADASVRSRGNIVAGRIQPPGKLAPKGEVDALPHVKRSYRSADGWEDPEAEISVGTPDVDGTTWGLPDLGTSAGQKAPRPARSGAAPAPSTPSAPSAPSAPASTGLVWAGLALVLVMVAAVAVSRR